MMDRIDTIARIQLACFPTDDLNVHKNVEALRRVRMGHPSGIQEKLNSLMNECCPKTIGCLNNAGVSLFNMLKESDELDQQQTYFWLQQRVHLLPYFDLTGGNHINNSKQVVSAAIETPWFFYLLYSDPLI